MFSKFFIDRPIFAMVLSIVVTIVGLVAVVGLPVAQYPDITPPTIQVSAVYPGASADVVEKTVASAIEQQVVGVENSLYMTSQSNSDGSYSLAVTFKLGTDLDTAQVLVQNRVAQATPSLPDAVKQIGVTVKKRSPSILQVVNLLSSEGRYDQLYLSNYATLQVRDELARIPGVGDIAILGQRDYSMRVWLNPEKLASRNMTARDVVTALREQNVQVAAGSLGAPPVPSGEAFQFTMSTLGRLVEPAQFENIVLKRGEGGDVVFLRDVARIELGAKNVNQSSFLDGKPTAGLAVYQQPGSNAIAVAQAIRAKMDELKARFPDGLDYAIVYDTTPFVEESIHEVFVAFRDAVVLVAIVVLVFLQSWRSSLIPLLAVPVSIIGTFAVMQLMGFSLNNLSLFGLVLAIGIVVDDAIVVVEAVEVNLHHGMAPREAAIKAMEQVGGPVIAIGIVLATVFIPAAFISGITGQFFRQFALTIATASVISALNSLTLSPALAALLLKPREAKPDILTRLLNLALGWFFRLFNRTFDLATGAYVAVVSRLLRFSVLVLVLYGGLLVLTWYSFTRAPGGFVPDQDKGYLLVNVQLPDAASLERTEAVVKRVEQIALATPGVRHIITVPGNSFLLGALAPNYAGAFVVLDEFDARRGKPELSANALLGKLQGAFVQQIPEASVGVFGAPPVDGLGNAGGFKLMVQDRGSLGLDTLAAQAGELGVRLSQLPSVRGAFSSFSAQTPQYFVDIDRVKVKSMGVPLDDVFMTLQAYLGGYYVNDFNEFGRTWQVNVQADAAFRLRPADVLQLKVRGANGEMVPLGAFASIRDVSGPVQITRYNTYPAAPINGVPVPGVSSGAVIDGVAAVATQQLPAAMAFEWTELTLLQVLEGDTAIVVFGFSVVLVFLVLAAQYESWSLPFAVILVVPMCLLCSIAGVLIASLDVNIFVQIGFIVLVGLAAKNAILIVEYAMVAQDQEGTSAADATLEACRLRLRPILMTSFAFILGVVPLALASGAGAEMRSTLGIAVFSGMLGVTAFGIFLTPVFYYVVRRLTGQRQPQPRADVRVDVKPTPAPVAGASH
jgi:hydrophobe/amphiphile efflux-1 (HAE1) family protein